MTLNQVTHRTRKLNHNLQQNNITQLNRESVDTEVYLPPDQPRLELCSLIKMPDICSLWITCREFSLLGTEDKDLVGANAEEHIGPNTKLHLLCA